MHRITTHVQVRLLSVLDVHEVIDVSLQQLHLLVHGQNGVCLHDRVVLSSVYAEYEALLYSKSNHMSFIDLDALDKSTSTRSYTCVIWDHLYNHQGLGYLPDIYIS